jgi:hypothetical protein
VIRKQSNEGTAKMDLYVKAKSKKAVNDSLANFAPVGGTNFSMFGGGGYYMLNAELPSGTVIKIYEKTVGGSPYAKAYGTWNAKTGRIK